MGEGKEDGMPFKEIEVLYSVAKVTVTYWSKKITATGRTHGQIAFFGTPEPQAAFSRLCERENLPVMDENSSLGLKVGFASGGQEFSDQLFVLSGIAANFKGPTDGNDVK
jgi:hypothetical protein